MRKAQDDPMARSLAEVRIGEMLIGYTETTEQAAEQGRTAIGEFKAVEFERTVRKVGDEEIKLRRLLLTGAWEVDPEK